MKTFALFAGVALAVPAVAQVSSSPATTPVADSATAPATETDAMTTPMAPATGSAPAAASAPAPAAPTDPKAILANEFPNYDKDKSGALDKAELTTWLTALQEAQPNGTTLTPEQKTAWLDKSFTDADSDKNGTVNLAELQKHLVPAA